MAKLNSIVQMLSVVAVFVLTGMLASGCSFPLEVKRPVLNSTGSTITHVFIRTAGSEVWGSEVNRKARTHQVTKYTQNGSYTTTEYVTDGSGAIIYDRYDLPHGLSYPYSFSVPKVPEGQTPQLKSVDVKLVDANGIAYGKNNVDLAQVERIVITKDDVYPVLIVQNNTGFRVQVIEPNAVVVDNGGSALVYQIKALGRAETVDVKLVDQNGLAYGKNNISLVQSERVVVTPDDMFPALSVQNNTGFPVSINEPRRVYIGNGNFAVVDQNIEVGRAKDIVVSYNSGTFNYKKEARLANEHTVITLTENDRPPIVNILNNTDKTINLVNLRNSGANSRWDGTNILTLNLKDDGTVETIDVGSQAGERRGSLTNKETFNFWLGNLKVNPGSYDIRLDNAQGDSYVKYNVQINRDVTLTFTPGDKP